MRNLAKGSQRVAAVITFTIISLGGQASLVVVIWRWDNGGQRGLGFLSRSVFLGLNFELYFRKGLRGHTMCDTIGGIP